jgi:hypothetical protein
MSNGDVMMNDNIFELLASEALDRDSYFRIPRVVCQRD